MHSIMIVFRLNGPADTTPGDLNSCMGLVQRTLPIALARPFVEQFVPEGTKVNRMLPCRCKRGPMGHMMGGVHRG